MPNRHQKLSLKLQHPRNFLSPRRYNERIRLQRSWRPIFPKFHQTVRHRFDRFVSEKVCWLECLVGRSDRFLSLLRPRSHSSWRESQASWFTHDLTDWNRFALSWGTIKSIGPQSIITNNILSDSAPWLLSRAFLQLSADNAIRLVLILLLYSLVRPGICSCSRGTFLECS